MALSKVTYVDGVTIIGAKNLNDIQDELIRQGEQQAEDKEATTAALALKADKSTTYTKTEVDSALAFKADKSDTYTKAEVDASLALKADKSDTYTKAQVDSALDLKADAEDVYTKTEIDTELEDYAKVDGSYEGMTVGNAEQLISSVKENDKVPYFFRTSGGNAEIGNRENDTIVGGSVAWNQLVAISVDAWTRASINYVELSLANDELTLTCISSVSTSSKRARIKNAPLNHVLLVSGTVKTDGVVSSFRLAHYNSAGSRKADVVVSDTDSYISGSNLVKLEEGDYIALALPNSTESGLYGVAKGIQMFDLTQMFGTTIANYIYSLEQANAGAGVAWFKKLFPKDYYEYNASEMLHVSGLQSHDMVGFNQANFEFPRYAPSITATIDYSKAIRVIKGMTYEMNHNGVSNATTWRNAIYCFDLYGNRIYSGSDIEVGGGLGGNDSGYYYVEGVNGTTKASKFTPKFDGYVMPFVCIGDTTAQSIARDSCVHLVWDGERDGEYEPYIKHSYPLDPSLTLRGILKLDASNQLYSDGDTYEHDGTVTRNIVEITFDGSENIWTAYPGYETTRCYASGLFSNRKPKYILQRNWGICNTMVCVDNIAGSSAKGAFSSSTANGGKNLYVSYPDGVTSVEEFKVWLSTHPTTLVYVVDTPTIETAESFADPQIVDNWGTEEYVTSSIVPVGHDTDYPVDLKAKVEASPNNPQSDGTYILSYQNGEATYTPLASNATITNIIARLEALEGGE